MDRNGETIEYTIPFSYSTNQNKLTTVKSGYEETNTKTTTYSISENKLTIGAVYGGQVYKKM